MHLRFSLLICLGLVSIANLASAAEKPNVLFIAIDDMNHWVGYLGRNQQTQTPNIDRLAANGVAFTKSYCTAPACNPSRASIMSGLRPSTSGCYLNGQNWRPGISEDKLLNTQFYNAGYRVYGAGKIYHGAKDRGGEWTDYFPGERHEMEPHASAKDKGVGTIKFYPLACEDEEMADYQVASYGIEKLQEKSDKPFFLAVGFVKPHLPFAVPQKWFDKFPLESIELPPYREDDLSDVPPAGVEMAKADKDHRQIVESGRWKEAVQAYLAAIAFCDAQVGRLLDALENSPNRDNTIVVLWSDHGWSLGEKSHWRKFALWEEPTRTVFTWNVPGLTKAGGMCGRPVDYLSIYPTLCELAGLPLPSHLDGKSIAPLLKDPQAEWELPAITTHGRGNHGVRAENWRYIRYANGDEELYDAAADPLEYKNLAGDAKYDDRKAELAKWLPPEEAKNLPYQGGVKKAAKKANKGENRRGKNERKANRANKNASQAQGAESK